MWSLQATPTLYCVTVSRLGEEVTWNDIISERASCVWGLESTDVDGLSGGGERREREREREREGERERERERGEGELGERER